MKSIFFAAFLCMSSHGNAQQSCDDAVRRAADTCKGAMNLASGSQGQAGQGSLNQSAQSQVSGIQLAMSDVNSARNICNDERKKCKQACGSGNNGSPSGAPGSNANQPLCQPNQQHVSGSYRGIPEHSPLPGQNCRATPLVIQIGDSLDLTPPWEGVFFDILGRNSFPQAFTKTLVSWLSTRSRSGTYFISLPNAKGEVLGIDQLFGDNTAGPDGAFAKNGFAALAKYDENLDGRIDAQDAVFPKLRLWGDVDGDGQSKPQELHTLSELGVESLDLNYDPNFAEEDAYGNQIKMKSVATTTDGDMHLIFDIWFNLNSNRPE